MKSSVLCIKLDGHASQICEAKYDNGSIIIEKFSEFALPDNCIKNDSIIGRYALINQLQCEIDKLDIKTKNVCFSFTNAPRIKVRICDTSKCSIEQYVKQKFGKDYELANKCRFSYAINNSYDINGKNYTEIVCLETPNSIIDTYQHIANDLGLQMVGLVNRAYAVADFLRNQLSSNSLILWTDANSASCVGVKNSVICSAESSEVSWTGSATSNGKHGPMDFSYNDLLHYLIGLQDLADVESIATQNRALFADIITAVHKLKTKASEHIKMINVYTQIQNHEHQLLANKYEQNISDIQPSKDFQFDNVYVFGVYANIPYLLKEIKKSNGVDVIRLAINNLKTNQYDIVPEEVIGCACAANPNANILSMLPAEQKTKQSLFSKLFKK